MYLTDRPFPLKWKLVLLSNIQHQQAMDLSPNPNLALVNGLLGMNTVYTLAITKATSMVPLHYTVHTIACALAPTSHLALVGFLLAASMACTIAMTMSLKMEVMRAICTSIMSIPSFLLAIDMVPVN